MTKISIYDVQNRYQKLSEGATQKIDKVYESQCNHAIRSESPELLIKCIENTKNINEFDINKVLDCFDTLCEVGTESQIIKTSQCIISEAMKKSRNAFDLNRLFKQRMGRLKNKNKTKLKNKRNNAVSSSMNNLKSKFSLKKEEAIDFAYQNMVNETVRLIHCDRILENYGSISTRFNIDKLFIENSYINGVDDTINELCHLIDTYDMPDITKLNTVIECGWYGLKNNHIPFNMSDLLEVVTDYFLMKENGLENCRTVLNNSVCLDKENLKNTSYLLEEDPEEKESIDKTVQEAVYSYTADEFSTLMDMFNKSVVIKESESFQDKFENFKKYNADADKNPNKLTQLIKKLYSSNVNNIIEDTPNFLAWIRRIFILGTCAINPVVTGVLLIANEFIAIHAERKEVEKMIKCFENEKEITEKKLESTKDPEKKERLEEYLDSINKVIDKINDYQDSILTDAETEKKYNSESDSVDNFKDIFAGDDNRDSNKKDEFDDMFDDMDFDDDDLEDFGEAVRFLPVISTLAEEFMVAKEKIDGLQLGEKEKLFSIMDDEDLKNLTVFSTMFPDCIDPDTIYYPISKTQDDIMRGNIQCENSLVRYSKLAACRDAIEILNNKEGKQIPYSNYIVENCYHLANAIRGMNAICQIVAFTPEKKDYLLEASFTNKLKLAAANLKKSIQNLSDKDKEVSRNIDVTMNKLAKDAERAITNNSREAVIKGSIIPSASRVIKLAITSGALFLVSPALAVIGILGYIGCTKSLQLKERQKIVDEIEIEEKMCEKYIDIAEGKGDTKALKQLYTIQRDLQRQKQRIKYGMKHVKNIGLVDPAKTEPGNNK